MSLIADRPADSLTAPEGPRPAVRRRRRAVGLALTVVAVLVLWSLGRLAGADYVITDSQGTVAISWLIAGGFTLLVGLLGWVVLALLERSTRYGARVWVGLAVAVTLASEVPVLLVEATTLTRVALFVLHLAVGATLVPVFVRARS